MRILVSVKVDDRPDLRSEFVRLREVKLLDHTRRNLHANLLPKETRSRGLEFLNQCIASPSPTILVDVVWLALHTTALARLLDLGASLVIVFDSALVSSICRRSCGTFVRSAACPLSCFQTCLHLFRSASGKFLLQCLLRRLNFCNLLRSVEK
jgi:hypothetical protein